MRSIIATLLVATAPVSAFAQTRNADLHQTLAELAFVLGESHALRQACSGTGDQYWRNRMIRMVDAEQPEPSLDRQIKDGFNAGFIARRSQLPVCAPAVARAQTAVAARGRVLSARLAKAKVITMDSESRVGMAEPAGPR